VILSCNPAEKLQPIQTINIYPPGYSSAQIQRLQEHCNFCLVQTGESNPKTDETALEGTALQHFTCFNQSLTSSGPVSCADTTVSRLDL
jgi:hypothetical protein